MINHRSQPKLLHGVGAPFGGGVQQSAAHRAALGRDIAALQPAWISDHLSFNQFAPMNGSTQTLATGFFLPPAQCPDGVTQAAAQIRHRRATTGVGVAFETPVSYLPPRPTEMSDGDFAAQVAEAADCGIVLDLHNLLCNERNGRQSVENFCAAIPLHRVWEIHVAGGEAQRGFWLDAHSGLVEPNLMAILAEIVPHLPSLGAIIFEIQPDRVASTGLPAIGKMLERLNRIWETAVRSAAVVTDNPACTRTVDPVTPSLWEHALGAALTGTEPPAYPPELANWFHSAEPALELYRYLAQEGRASALVDTAPRTIRSLLTNMGEARTRDVLGQFWRVATPAYTSSEEALAFLDFLSAGGFAEPRLDADIASDRSRLMHWGEEEARMPFA
ncbi:DUF692 family multinuclear iron-containing protein [Acidisphaera sp. S103]|uniref:multinuclear nonheme iron-dependent oxidase n=1 Tax=Acidisphaera sp. S103 TaxID=1747223 RepID=UPI00352C734D